MCHSRILKWLYLIAGTGILWQPAPGGCPNGPAIKDVAADSVQFFVEGVIGLYVENAVNTFFHV